MSINKCTESVAGFGCSRMVIEDGKCLNHLVFGLKEKVKALEAQNAAMRDALMTIRDHEELLGTRDYLTVSEVAAEALQAVGETTREAASAAE